MEVIEKITGRMDSDYKFRIKVDGIKEVIESNV